MNQPNLRNGAWFGDSNQCLFIYHANSWNPGKRPTLPELLRQCTHFNLVSWYRIVDPKTLRGNQELQEYFRPLQPRGLQILGVLSIDHCHPNSGSLGYPTSACTACTVRWTFRFMTSWHMKHINIPPNYRRLRRLAPRAQLVPVQ